jgi:hypothetical protein
LNVIERVTKREADNLVRLTCGHEFITENPHVRAGNQYHCPECNRTAERRRDVQPCTDAQLDAVAADYAETMRARGVVIGKPEEVAIRRAAAIQDVWRVAFKRVLG